jgi:hypothetical protein
MLSCREGPALNYYQQYCILLDVALMLLPDAARSLASTVQACLSDRCCKVSDPEGFTILLPYDLLLQS